MFRWASGLFLAPEYKMQFHKLASGSRSLEVLLSMLYVVWRSHHKQRGCLLHMRQCSYNVSLSAAQAQTICTVVWNALQGTHAVLWVIIFIDATLDLCSEIRTGFLAVHMLLSYCWIDQWVSGLVFQGCIHGAKDRLYRNSFGTES